MKFYISFLFLVFFSLNANSSIIEEILIDISKNNDEVISYDYKLEGVKSEINKVESILNPVISSNFSFKKDSYYLKNNMNQFDEKVMSASVNVRQVLFDATIDEKLKYSNNYYLSILHENNNKKEAINIKFFELLLNRTISKESIDIYNKMVDSLERQNESIKEKLKFNLSTKNDLLNIESELINYKTLLSNEIDKVNNIESKIFLLTGSDKFKKIEKIDVDFSKISKHLNNYKWIDYLENNSILKSKNKVLEFLDNEISVIKNENKPKVDLVGSYSKMEGSTYFAQKNDNAVIMIEMKMPLYDGGINSINLNAGYNNYKSAFHDYENYKRNITNNINEYYLNIKSSLNKNKYLEELVKSKEEIVLNSSEMYDLGLLDVNSFLLSKEKLIDAQKEKSINKISSIYYLINLYYLTGKSDDIYFYDFLKSIN